MIKALSAVDLGARYLAGNVYPSRTTLPDSLLENNNVSFILFLHRQMTFLLYVLQVAVKNPLFG